MAAEQRDENEGKIIDSAEDNRQNLVNLCYDKTAPKIICIGRNYLSHCEKRDVDIPKSPMFFLKPKSSLVVYPEPICLPANMKQIHYEVELVVLIGKKLKLSTMDEARDAIFGYDIGIDITNREIQNQERSKGISWTLSKCMDGFSVLTGKILPKNLVDLNNTIIWLKIDDEKRQETNINKMIFSVPYLLSYISQYITIYPGDILFTGTPGETGELLSGHSVKIGIDNFVMDENERKEARKNVCQFTFEVL